MELMVIMPRDIEPCEILALPPFAFPPSPPLASPPLAPPQWLHFCTVPPFPATPPAPPAPPIPPSPPFTTIVAYACVANTVVTTVMVKIAIRELPTPVLPDAGGVRLLGYEARGLFSSAYSGVIQTTRKSSCYTPLIIGKPLYSPHGLNTDHTDVQFSYTFYRVSQDNPIPRIKCG
jgi:hypothetical protein